MLLFGTMVPMSEADFHDPSPPWLCFAGSGLLYVFSALSGLHF